MSSRFSALNFGYVAFAVTSSRFFISIPPLFICPPKRAPIHHRRQSGLLCAPPRQAQSCTASRCAGLVMVLLLFQSRFLIPPINWLSPVWIIPFFIRISRTRRRIFITRHYNNRRHKRYASAMSRLYHKYCPTLGGQM